jgi:5-methylcytosine-specific restriction enzyme A
MAKLKTLKPRLHTLGASEPKARGWAPTSSTERGYGWQWQKLRLRILARDCGLCQCEDCKRLGRVRLATEVDHHIPKFEGGTDDESNLRAISAECHKLKTAAESARAKANGSAVLGPARR